MNRKLIYATTMLVAINLSSYAQFGKLKGLMGKKDSTKTEEPKKDGGGGGGFMNKAMSKISKGAFAIGGAMTGTDMVGSTDDLNSVDVNVSYMQNLHPIEVQEVGQNFFNGWEPGGTGMLLMMTSKTKMQLTKLKGDVKIDGKPANYVMMGFYSSFTKDNAPKKIELKSNSGQDLSFMLNPPTQKVKLLSINGQTSNANLDMSKDVVLEFADMPEDTKTPIMVQLTGSQIGIKTFFLVGWFNPKKKIIIPPSMFRQMPLSGLSLKNCYLQVSRGKMEKVTNATGVSQNLKVGSIVHDGMFVTINNPPTFSKELVVKGKEGSSDYEIKKGNAVMSPYLGNMKSLGVMGFAAKGSTSYFDRKTKYQIGEGYSTTTKMATFPKLPNQMWDQALADLYVKVTEVLKSEFNIEVVALDKITNSAAYKVTKPYETPEANTHDEFFITYKNTKALSPFRPFGEMGGLSSPEYQIMQEVGVNSLLKLTLGFQMNFEGNSAFMVPSLNFDITGTVVGDLYPTNYLTGTVTGQNHYLSKKNKLETVEDLTKALDLNGMTAAFRKAMQDIKSKELENGDYEIVWKAMNQ